MKAKIIYNIFETSEKHNVDTAIAAEILRGREVIPDAQTKAEIGAFVGLHYDPLWRAYQTGNRKLFDDIVRICQESTDEEADVLLRAHATGNEKLIAEMEAKYGNG